MSPLEWARQAIGLYHHRPDDRIIGEKNNGGDLIESTLRQVDPNIPYSAVCASRGKVKRAEPVAALFQQASQLGLSHPNTAGLVRLQTRLLKDVASIVKLLVGRLPDRKLRWRCFCAAIAKPAVDELV
jgi:phage terminase large subunit-like protein